MTTYTVYCEYGATGEGITHMIWYGFCENESEAMKQFTLHFDPYYAQGAQVVKGFCFENRSARLLVSDAARKLLTDPECYKSFHAQIHVNYS
jgi:hypothetical protein